jgi:hypothetical protein
VSLANDVHVDRIKGKEMNGIIGASACSRSRTGRNFKRSDVGQFVGAQSMGWGTAKAHRGVRLYYE